MNRRSFFASFAGSMAAILPAKAIAAQTPRVLYMPGKYEWEAPIIQIVEEADRPMVHQIYAGGIKWMDAEYDLRFDDCVAHLKSERT